MTKNIKKKFRPDLMLNNGGTIEDPYKTIGDFFSQAPLEHYRKYISSMLKAAYSEDFWKKATPGSLLFFQDRMLELICATYLFVTNKNDRAKRKRKAVVDETVLENGIDSKTYFGWHRKSAIWEFFPRYISKEEFLNPYKVYDRFFEYWDVQTWIKEFREIISFALDAYGNETGCDYDYLEIHKQLQKLVEASHLIEVRVVKPDQLRPQTDISTDKAESNGGEEIEVDNEAENYSNDPYKIIGDFFLDGDAQDGRDDLNILFEAAFPDDLIVRKHYPSRLVFAYERIDKLIDAAYSLNQEECNGKKEGKKLDGDIIDRVKVLYKKVKDWDQFPYKLRPVEWVKPRMAIRAFFEHQPLSHWKGKLHELLQACVRDESFCSTISDRSKLYLDCEHLQRLVEALWVIMVMEIR
jgi:hypothetical protein